MALSKQKKILAPVDSIEKRTLNPHRTWGNRFFKFCFGNANAFVRFFLLLNDNLSRDVFAWRCGNSAAECSSSTTCADWMAVLHIPLISLFFQWPPLVPPNIYFKLFCHHRDVDQNFAVVLELRLAKHMQCSQCRWDGKKIPWPQAVNQFQVRSSKMQGMYSNFMQVYA